MMDSMTTRSQDRPPQGTGPDARKTTQQSMIAAIGASGAVIAGGVTDLRPAGRRRLVRRLADVRPGGPGKRNRAHARRARARARRRAARRPAVPFGSGPLVTEPATVVVAPAPGTEPGAPKLAGGRDVVAATLRPPRSPRSPAAAVVARRPRAAAAAGPRRGGTEEPIPQEPAEDEPEVDQDDRERSTAAPGTPRAPRSRPPTPAPAPVTSGASSGARPASPTSGSGLGGRRRRFRKQREWKSRRTRLALVHGSFHRKGTRG